MQKKDFIIFQMTKGEFLGECGADTAPFLI